MRIFANTTYDFLRWRWYAVALSAVVLLAGVGLAVKQGGPAMGIDFAGGTSIILKFEQPPSEETVRQALEGIPGDKVVQQYGQPADNEIMVRLPIMEGSEQGANLAASSKHVEQALQKSDEIGSFTIAGRELVGPVIGRDLQRRGIWAVVLSIVGIGVYIALRFRPSFAIGAMAATFHDILVVVAFLVFIQQFRAGYELSLNVVAAMLTIAGYSVNDTIVVFDRVRENLRGMRRESLTSIVNRSVNQTLNRTVITTGTTLLAVLALYLYGGEVLKGFAYTILVGVIAGTYSTVFIASSLAIMMSRRGKLAPARATPTAAPEAAPPTPVTPKVRRRKVRG